MQEISSGLLYNQLTNKKRHFPLSGQIELTYRCNLDCIHCYCKGCEDRDKELTADEWKKILDVIQQEGCLYLTFTGGEPLIRKDFLELYSYAKGKGFIITLFTNGQAFTKDIIDYLVKSPPCSIEITLNGISKGVYEAVTQIEGSYLKVIKNLKLLKAKGLPLIIKTNCLKQNRRQLGKIKAFTEKLLGKPAKGRHYFRYDPMIYPRLNGDKEPLNFRLSFEELLQARKEDPDIWREYQKALHINLPGLKRSRVFLYRCDSWFNHFFISPYGRLKFCEFSEKFSIDLKAASFRDGFYNVFAQILKQRFKTDSKCRDCALRPACHHCPARAYLETKDEEKAVEYYCEITRKNARQNEIPALS